MTRLYSSWENTDDPPPKREPDRNSLRAMAENKRQKKKRLRKRRNG